MPSPEMWKQLNNNSGVRAALRTRGRAIAARAQEITDAEGGSATIRIVEGIRPKGRAFLNVVSDKPAEEYGNESTPKIRAIGRASRER